MPTYHARMIDRLRPAQATPSYDRAAPLRSASYVANNHSTTTSASSAHFNVKQNSRGCNGLTVVDARCTSTVCSASNASYTSGGGRPAYDGLCR
jgi:hypothetical protein